jgi:carboxyl-terminal processing protease
VNFRHYDPPELSMPRRNYLTIVAAVVISVVCYFAADRNPLGRSFSEVADLVQRHYVGRVDRQSLWAAGVRGMLNELGDPYSEYINPAEAAEFDAILNQEFGGIGIYVDVDQGSKRPVVISPIIGSPAYKAGVLAGDVISKIDGQPTREMSYADATSHIRGKVGDVVKLTVERAGKTEPIDLPPIERQIINTDSVLGDTHDATGHWTLLLPTASKIGYVRITSFGERTVGELKAALEELKSQGMQALMLDLRNDPGGLVPAAVGVCDLFVVQGKPIVSTRGRGGQIEREYVAGGGEKHLDFPMAVLVNEYSASASEIVAACLQDNGRAKIIGERSYGKGTVQNFLPLSGHEGVLKLTTANYCRPSGRNIQRPSDEKESDQWGVSPDAGFEVKMTEEQFRKWMQWRRERDRFRTAQAGDNARAVDTLKHDPSLAKAVEYLETQIK